jgi:hypothetical protein
VIEIPPQAFPLGRLRITPRAQAALKQAGVSAWTLLFAHGSGAWVAEEDKEHFQQAVEHDLEIVSIHVAANGARLAVRTSEGHRETVIMMEEERP